MSMQYAINHLSERIEPYPGATGNCPVCVDKVIAKCGSIMAWHWAHTNTSLSCAWEPETSWHRDWKMIFPAAQREVVVQRDGRKKIADIQTSRTVIEFQHSSISSEEIETRENHYGNMVWVFDCREAYDAGRIKLDFNRREFFWGKSRPTYFTAKKEVYLQLATDLLIMIYDCRTGPAWAAGEALILTKQDFLWKHSDHPWYQLKEMFSTSYCGIHF